MSPLPADDWTATKTDINDVRQDLRRVESNLNAVKAKVGETLDRVKGLESRFDQMNDHLTDLRDEMERRFNRLEEFFTELPSR